MSKWGASLDKAFNLRLAFLHKSSIWVLKESIESILAPINLSCVLLLFISLVSTSKLTFSLVLHIKLHLSGFNFICVSPNNWNSVFEVFCNLTINSSILFPTTYGVLSSAYLANRMLLIIRKRSQRKILNKRGSSMEPCRTPHKNSSHELYSTLILVLCFRFER